MNFDAGQTLLFDKPKNWTSFDLVAKLRKLCNTSKIGHAGTLDPLATGLLIVCTGKNTKSIDELVAAEKEYEVEMRLGATTPSYDAEFPPENIQPSTHITEAILSENMAIFLGVIEQIPPIFSAIQVDGKRAYKAARQGKEIELPSRSIEIRAYTLLEYEIRNSEGVDYVWAKARVVCSKGTYIRSLVHDLGQKLGCGAYILELRRTRIGDFKVEDAFTMESFGEFISQNPPESDMQWIELGKGKLHLNARPQKDEWKKWKKEEVRTLVSLLNFGEKCETERSEVRKRNWRWIHLPLSQISKPEPSLLPELRQQLATVLEALENGENIVIHCTDGIRRTLWVASLLLQMSGKSFEESENILATTHPKLYENRRDWHKDWVESFWD